MAKKNVEKLPFPGKHCSDCGHHYDEHSRAHDGGWILCRCPFKMDGGKYCIFMKQPACERFIPMTNGHK